MIAVISTPSSRNVRRPTRIDGQHFHAELAQLHRTLLGDDDTDQETHQADDAQRRDANDLEPLDHRIQPEPAGVTDDAPAGDQRAAEKAEQAKHGSAGCDHCLADLADDATHRRDMIGTDGDRLVQRADRFHQPGCVVAAPADGAAQPLCGAMHSPRADRVDMIDICQVDRPHRTLHGIQTVGQVVKAGNRQRPGKPDHRAVIAHFFGKVGGFVHAMELLIQYRLHGKPKRPIATSERRAGEKVSDTA